MENSKKKKERKKQSTHSIAGAAQGDKAKRVQQCIPHVSNVWKYLKICENYDTTEFCDLMKGNLPKTKLCIQKH